MYRHYGRAPWPPLGLATALARPDGSMGGCQRRRFFADTGRRRMLAASLLDEDGLSAVEELPGPYFFVSDGVLAYLREQEVTSAVARIAARFPGSSLAFDTYPQAALKWEHKMAARRGIARWQWSRRPAHAGAAWPVPG